MFHPILDVVIGLVLYLTFFYPTIFKWCPFIIYFQEYAAKTILENYEKVIDLPMILALPEEFRDILKELLLKVTRL